MDEPTTWRDIAGKVSLSIVNMAYDFLAQRCRYALLMVAVFSDH